MNPFLALMVFFGSSSAALSALAEEKCDPEIGIQLSLASDVPWTMQIQLVPMQIPLNAPFDAHVTVCSQSENLPTRITVEATMPAHNHGMNYEPLVSQIGRHSYEVKNLLFHMPGVWRLVVTAYEDNQPYRFTHDVILK